MFSCRVERDSVNPHGDRLTSFVVSMPRVILAETRTHRRNSATTDAYEEVSWSEATTDEWTSKNSSSTRAVPLARMINKVATHPYVPEWTLDQRGMQGGYMSDTRKLNEASDICLRMLQDVIDGVKELEQLGVHKQDAGRYLEPWSWVTQIMTSSRWDNFFALRCHPAAYPPFRKVARMMFLAQRKSIPVPLEHGQWHLPFVPLEEQTAFNWKPDLALLLHGVWPEIPDLIKFSAARCAWMSYENADKDGSKEALLRTWNRLFAEVPVHACYDAQTEVLTGEGWKKWPDVTGSESFVTLSKDNEIQYQAASRLVSKDYDGPMFRVENEHVNLLVTPGHRMFASPKTKDGFVRWEMIPVDTMMSRCYTLRHGEGEWDGDLDLPDGWGKLIGFVIGDGSYSDEAYSVTFHLRKERKVSWLYEAAEAARMTVKKHSGEYFYLSCPSEFKKILSRCYSDNKEKQIPPDLLLRGKKKILVEIMSGLIESDGHVAESGKTSYSTTSLKLANQFQELALKCGGYASLRLNSEEGQNAWGGPAKACYSLCLFRKVRLRARIGWTTTARKKEVTVEPYKGKVYCVTVPNGIIYVRRNGEALWCGNSPVEHQATPMTTVLANISPRLKSNLSGWVQARKLLPLENIEKYEPTPEEVAAWPESREGVSL